MRPLQWISPSLFALTAFSAVPEPGTAQVVQGHEYEVEAVETGSQIYASRCAVCHGSNGDQIAGVDLRHGQVTQAASETKLRQAIRGGNLDAGMPQFNLPPDQLDALVAFIQAGMDVGGTAVGIGSPAQGMTLFEGEAGCTRCHSANGRRAGLAPDLSDIGDRRDAEYLQRTLLDPSGAMLPINRPVTAVTDDGRTIRGRRLNEDTYTVQIVDDEGRLRSLIKADLHEFEVSTESPMPSVEGRLNPRQVADLIAYLLSLQGAR